MAWSSACCSFYQNLLVGGKDKIVGAAPTKSDNTLISAISFVCTPAPVLAPNLAEQVFKYTNDDLQKATKLALELFYQRQQHQPLLKPQKRPLKAWFSDFCKGKLQMNCYHFLQQYEDYFDITGAIDKNCTSFATLFFHKSINIWWTQYKLRYGGLVPISWPKFKRFLCKNLGNFRTFVDSIYSKLMKDSQY